MARGKGYRHEWDERNRQFRAKVAVEQVEPWDKPWRNWYARGAFLNQGSTGTCVGHGMAHAYEDGPKTHPGTIDPFEVYRHAVLLDDFADNDNEAKAPKSQLQSGTSVLAGMKALQEMGLITAYRWVLTYDELVDTLLNLSSIVVGTNWYSGMEKPVPRPGGDYRLFITPNGVNLGGHCYVIDGINTTTGWARMKNSWGTSWGHDGFAWIMLDDLRYLLFEDLSFGPAEVAVITDA